MAYEAPLSTSIKKYVCIRVIEKERTRNYCGVHYCLFLTYCEHSSYTANIPCFWAIPLVVSHFTTPIASIAYSSARGMIGWLYWRLKEMGCVPLLLQLVH